MRYHYLMLAISILLVYSAGTMAAIFGTLYFLDTYLAEPDPRIALLEMLLATIFALTGLAAFVVSLWHILKKHHPP